MARGIGRHSVYLRDVAHGRKFLKDSALRKRATPPPDSIWFRTQSEPHDCLELQRMVLLEIENGVGDRDWLVDDLKVILLPKTEESNRG